ncbi:MAG: ribonuclease HI [Alphaproteobacteria bacterium]|nr:MAG: ribonuclease HI [Alphaproteobacteria bacterium]
MSWQLIADGSCIGNPGMGGWAFILTDGDVKIVKSGFDVCTTNNRMELQSLINGLAGFNELNIDQELVVTMDSQYVLKGIQTWIHTWKKNNWLTSAKKPVKNKDLWTILDKQIPNLKLQFDWTKGHNGHVLHDTVDVIARCSASKHQNCVCPK